MSEVKVERSRNAIKIRHGIKWSAAEERRVYETMARVLIADARAHIGASDSVPSGRKGE